MHILYAVVDDLYAFVMRVSRSVSYFLIDSEPESLHVVNVVYEDREQISENKNPQVTEVSAPQHPTYTMSESAFVYIQSKDTPLFAQPTNEFDGIVRTLPYGDRVTVLDEEKGKYIHVSFDHEEGWISRDDCTKTVSDVYPVFVVGKANEADDVNTVRVRAVIGDLFGGGRIEYPLQAGEYIMYRLFKRRVSIAWPAIRPRVPGNWHRILRGVPGIHIGITPKTGAVMEYMMQEEIGHTAYVEAVFPDGSIELSEANYPDRGVYNERTLTREEWLMLRPVFIEVF